MKWQFADDYGNTLPWREITWSQRLMLCLFWAIMWGVVLPVMLVGALWLLGSIGDGIGRYNSEHDSCLKHATNGYEIRQCH